MDKNKIKEYLNSLKEISSDKKSIISSINSNEYKTNNKIETCLIQEDIKGPDTDRVIGYRFYDIVTPESFEYDGETLKLTLNEDKFNNILNYYDLNKISKLDLILPIDSRAVSRCDVVVTSLSTKEELDSYRNDYTGAIKVNLLPIYKSEGKISIQVETDGTCIFDDHYNKFYIGVDSSIDLKHNYQLKRIPRRVYKVNESFDVDNLVVVDCYGDNEIVVDSLGYTVTPTILTKDVNEVVVNVGGKKFYIEVYIMEYDDFNYQENYQETIYSYDKFKLDLNLLTSKTYFTFKGVDLLSIDLVYDGGLKTNLSLKLELNGIDDETNTIYSLKDAYDNEVILEEKYYYIENNAKKYINKNSCRIDIDGSIYYNEHEVKKEQTNSDYELIAEIDDYIDSKYIEQKTDEEKNIETTVKNYEANLINYVKVNGSNGNIVETLDELTESGINRLFNNLTTKSPDSFLTSRGESNDYNIILTVSEAINLKSLYNSYYSNIDQDVSYTGQLESIENSTEYAKKMKEIIKKEYSNANEFLDYKSIILDITDEQETVDLNEKRELASYVNNNFQAKQGSKNTLGRTAWSTIKLKEHLEKSSEIIKSQIKYIISNSILNTDRVKESFDEYFKLKRQYELIKKLQPINYVKKENLIYGFNEENNLCRLISKDNYYQIKYENGLIKSVSDDNNDVVSFAYEGNKLTGVCDYLGNNVVLKYDSNNLSSIKYNDLELVITSNLNILSISDGYKNIKFSYSDYLNNIKAYVNDEKIEDITINKSNNQTKIINNIDSSYSLYEMSDNNRILYKEDKDKLDNKSIIYNQYSISDNVERIFEIDDSDKATNYVDIKRDKNTKNIISSNSKKVIGDWFEVEAIEYNYDLNNNLINTISKKYINSYSVKKTIITNYYYNNLNKLIKKEEYVDGCNFGKNILEYIYDKNGNVVKEITYNSNSSTDKSIKEYHYTSDNLIDYTIDDIGLNKTYYEYENNRVCQIKYPNSLTLGYGYDNDKLTSITRSSAECEGNTSNVLYEHGLKIRESSGNNTYDYSYDNNRRLKSVKINGKTVCRYSYTNYNRNSTSINLEGVTRIIDDTNTKINVESTMANDELVKTTKMNDSIISQITYDKLGQITKIDDKFTGIKSYYKYNNLNMLSKVESQITEEYEYENLKLVQKKYSLNDKEINYIYSYNEKDLIDYISQANYKFEYKYDSINRGVGRDIIVDENKILGSKIGYLKNGNYTTKIPNTIYYSNGLNVKCKYDEVGNIKEVYENNELVNRYTYDTLSRIIREDNKKLNKTTTYSYDNNGNILNKRSYEYTLELLNNSYENDNYIYNNWLLIKLNDIVIEYDKLGRPIKIKDKDLSWGMENTLTKYGTNTYDYDAFGLRTKKNNIKYMYDSENKLIYESRGIYYIYEEGKLAGLNYNNKNYFYIYDLLGNIINIIDDSGKIVVKYSYDSFGNHEVYNSVGEKITDQNDIGNINPFRYKGYYFDSETNLYYLQTRYYDPSIGRFISPDSIDYLNNESVDGLNLYAYCGNNPVMRVDPTGHFWNWTTFWKGIGMFATAVVAVALSVTTFGAGIPLAMSIVAGITLGAGVLTGINGIATMVEAGTDYNFVRDGLFNDVLGLSDTVYNVYAGIVEVGAMVGSMVLGFYHTTGQYKAAKASQRYLGKGYSKAAKNRWISKDGYRQVRWDTTHHMYNGKPSSVHFNWYEYKYPIAQGVRNKAIQDIHVWVKWFNYYM